MPQILVAPLVGMHFRPPAKAILAALRAGSPLVLEPEPDHPYDPKAIKVLVDLREVLTLSQYPALDGACAESGHSLVELLEAGGLFHLGYVADSDGKAKGDWSGNREIGQAIWHNQPKDTQAFAALAFDGNGKPLVKFIITAEAVRRKTNQ